MSRTGHDTARLEDHILRALPTPKIQQMRIFGRDSDGTSFNPMLKKGKTNRIIYYLGNFNPPHVGHLALLKYAFEKGGEDFKAFAAIIIPHTDHWVQTKSFKTKDKIVFDMQQRMRLVKEGFEHLGWCWVHDGGSMSWYTLSSEIGRDGKEEGFEVEFHELLGPDFIKTASPQLSREANGIITSNMCRKVDFLPSEDDPPRELRLCHKWEKIGAGFKKESEHEDLDPDETEDEGDDKPVFSPPS